MRRFREKWSRLSIRKKLHIPVMLFLLVVLVTAVFDLLVLRLYNGDIGGSLSDTACCETAQEAMSREADLFRTYMQERTDDTRAQYLAACEQTAAAVAALPDSFEKIGQERFARTWNIRSSYENYVTLRDETAAMDTEEEGYLTRLYEVYDQQTYLKGYLENLLQLTVKDSMAVYESRSFLMSRLPLFLLLLSALLLILAFAMNHTMTKAFLSPIQSMVAASRRMEKGDYGGEKIQAANRDELGELASSFNKMRRATRENIETLQENQKLQEKVHQDSMERMELQSQLETTRLDLLQSQIQPHFLFNTLNTIAGAADLEDAPQTRRMIVALSNLFRYNLQTSEQFCALSNEVQMVRDYMYLQQMRFGSRVQYQEKITVDMDACQVPVHLLQPLVENAVVHGVTKTERGGTVSLGADRKGDVLEIRVEDDGAGIPDEKLAEIRRELQNDTKKRDVHIGLGNTARRIRRLYPGGDLEIESKEGKGTTVRIRMPMREEGRYEQHTDRG